MSHVQCQSQWRQRLYSAFVLLLFWVIECECAVPPNDQQQQLPQFRNLFDPQVSLTVNPRTRHLQIYWSNIKVARGDRILITDVDPEVDQFQRFEEITTTTTTITTETTLLDNSGVSTTTSDDFITSLYSLDKFLGIGAFDSTEEEETVEPQKFLWKFGDPAREVLYSMMIQEPTGWWKTNIPFDNNILRDLTNETSCFGFWIHMINANGTVITRSCMKAHPRWMNEMREEIGDVKMRHLFIPGTHNSGSSKGTLTENRLTKYAICQDDDIRSQLMQGIRYLDLRVGHYRKLQHAFYIVHSVVKFQPLIEVLETVKDFVEETNEIVIIDFQEFPIGFYPDETEIHKKLVQFIYDTMKDHLVEPFGTWDVTLNDLWRKRGNVIIGYDKPGIQFEFRELLWQSVEHFWPNKADITSLVNYLRTTRNNTSTWVFNFRSF